MMQGQPTIGIIGAMQPEIKLLKNRLEQRQTHEFGNGLMVYTGKIGQQNIALSLSGIGKVNAAIATTLLLQHFAADCIINTGSAGGIGAGLSVGDIVIGTEIAHHDVDVSPFGYTHGQVPQLPARFVADSDLIQAATDCAAIFKESYAKARVITGLIVSGLCVYPPSTIGATDFASFSRRASSGNGSRGHCPTCYQFHKPFVIIRAISDGAQEEAKISFDEFLQTAAKHSAQMVLNLIKTL